MGGNEAVLECVCVRAGQYTHACVVFLSVLGGVARASW